MRPYFEMTYTCHTVIVKMSHDAMIAANSVNRNQPTTPLAPIIIGTKQVWKGVDKSSLHLPENESWEIPYEPHWIPHQ